MLKESNSKKSELKNIKYEVTPIFKDSEEEKTFSMISQMINCGASKEDIKKRLVLTRNERKR